MIKITYRPPRELIILDLAEYPLDKFSDMIIALRGAGHDVIPNWAEGILFIASPLAMKSEGMAKEILEGRLYWSNVSYAFMPEYKSVVRVSTYEYPVMDLSSNPFMREVAEWLKKQSKRGEGSAELG